jgi:hypothetical protein
MSSVAGSGSGETTSKLQAVYKERERDLKARHRDDIAELKAENHVEVEAVRRESRKRVEAVQNESAEKLSEKDIQHQKEIESIKSIYSKRMAELSAKKGEV